MILIIHSDFFSSVSLKTLVHMFCADIESRVVIYRSFKVWDDLRDLLLKDNKVFPVAYDREQDRTRIKMCRSSLWYASLLPVTSQSTPTQFSREKKTFKVLRRVLCVPEVFHLAQCIVFVSPLLNKSLSHTAFPQVGQL